MEDDLNFLENGRRPQLFGKLPQSLVNGIFFAVVIFNISFQGKIYINNFKHIHSSSTLYSKEPFIAKSHYIVIQYISILYQ